MKNFPLFDSVAAALGGKRISGALWALLCVASFAGFLFSQRHDRHVAEGKGAGILILSFTATALVLVYLLRGLFFGRYRAEMFERVSPEARPRPAICFFIRAVPFLAVAMWTAQLVLR
jgi:hypothetical protein